MAKGRGIYRRLVRSGWNGSILFLLVLLGGCAMPGAPDQIGGWHKDLYTKNCAGCHGPDGKGDGPPYQFLYPRPRNITKGEFKFGGSLPELEHTIGNGIPGTAMPSFSRILKPNDVRALAYYVRKMAGKNAPPAEILSVTVPENIGSVSNGKKLYQKNCAKCHGPEGLGDGPSALTLRDSSDIPIRPRSLVNDFFKGGEEADILYRLILRGLPGTPMPGFEAALKEQERWDLVAFVKSLRTKKAPTVITDIKAGKTSRVPEEPNAPDWAHAPSVQLQMQPIWKRPDWPADLSVKALSDGKRIAFLLEWEDKTADRTVGRVQDFLDAAAVMVPESPDFYPFIGMGSMKDPVRIWQWRAITEKAGPESAYGKVERDTNPWEEEPMAQPAHAAGNPLARDYGKAVEGKSVLEYLAGGPGTLTFIKPQDQKVRGQGTWVKGKWKVVLVQDNRKGLWYRPKALSPGTKTSVTFALWDGSAGDRNGQKSISQWINVEVQK